MTTDYQTAAARCRDTRRRLDAALRRLGEHEHHVGGVATAAQHVSHAALKEEIAALRQRLHDQRGERDRLAGG